MIPPKVPDNEEERLSALESYNVLDTLSEKNFEDITQLAALICETPISLISLVDKDRQWFKSHHGLDAVETSREIAYCAHAINKPEEILEVPDAFKDERFHDNPLATGDPHVRFYAGAPLMDKDGFPLGTLCVIDHEPKKLTKTQKEALQKLSNQVTSQLELRKTIGQLKETEKKRKQEEITFQHRIERVGDMVYELDDKGKFIYVNPALINISGLSKQDLLSMHFWELVIPETMEEVITYYKNIFKEKIKSSYLEFDMKGLDGPVCIGQNVEVDFKDDRVHRVYGVARDISDVVDARKSLEKSEEKYRLISENSTDLICLHDSDGTFKFLSSSVKELLGYEPEELIGTNPYDIFHPKDKDRIKKTSHKQVLEGKDVVESEYRMRKKNGEYVWLETNTKPIMSNGVVARIQTSSRDVTTRKKYEDELKLTKEFAEKAKEEAIESAKAKESFLSIMSHEIRTPMNAILGVTNLLLQEDFKQAHLEHLKLQKFSGENLLTIINDILDFNKIEAGKVEFESIDFNLKEVLFSIKQSLLPKAEEKGVDLILRYDENLPDIFIGDSVRVSQVINNLVGNAIKFTEEGFVKVTVSLKGYLNNKAKIHFEIQDSGIGVSKEEQTKIFENFSQAQSDTTRKYGGTGLGLTITKRLLELMDSAIFLESKPGQGAIFYFDISLPVGGQNGNALQEDSQSNGMKDLAEENLNILIAEDNKGNQIVLSQFLKKWGIESDIAENGKEAIEMLKSKAYNLIFMDLQMPEMGGYEATQKIRASKDRYFKNIPIIALSATAMLDMQKDVKDRGMTDFVAKPFGPKELYDKISQHGLAVESLRKNNNKSNRFKQVIEDYAEGDSLFMIELTDLYIENYESFRKSFTTAIEMQDEKGIRQCFHRVRTSIKDFHLKDMENLMDVTRTTGYSQNEVIKQADDICDTIIEQLRNIKDEVSQAVS